MSEHIYDELMRVDREIRHLDKKYENMIYVLIMRLIQKKIITMQEATEILTSTFHEAAMKQQKEDHKK